MTVKELMRERLKMYLECERAILKNQEYTIGDRTYKRADLATIKAEIRSMLNAGVTLDENEIPPARGGSAYAEFES